MAEVSSVRIFGERCSGTNYLESLLEVNVPICKDRPALKDGVYGYKHWFCEDLTVFEPANNVLFIFIIRGPAYWLASLNKTPFHAAKKIHELDFSSFIRVQWHCVWDEVAKVAVDAPIYGTEMMHERNPETGERLANVLELRSTKLRNWMAVQEVAKNCLYLKYEDLVESPEWFFSRLKEEFGITTKAKVENVTTRRGLGAKKFTPNSEPQISKADAHFICDNLDWTLEEKIGYSTDDVLRYIR